MKYYRIYQIKNGDEFLLGETDDIFEAMEIARSRWDYFSKWERKKNELEIRHYLNDPEDEECIGSDYEVSPEAWYYWYAVLTDEDDCDHGYGSHDWHEAYNMAVDLLGVYPNAMIATVDYRDDFCIDVESVKEIKKLRETY